MLKWMGTQGVYASSNEPFVYLKLETVCITEGYFALRRRYPHPTSDKRACRSSGGVCEADPTGKARRAASHGTP